MVDEAWVEPSLPGIGGVVADHSPDCYMEHGRLIIRPSMVGGCTKALIAQGMGMTGQGPPAKLVDRMAESAKLEGVLLEKGLGQWKQVPVGERVRGVDNIQVSHGQWLASLDIGRNVLVRGHLDALAWCPRSVHVVEAKAPGPAMWKDWMKRNRESEKIDWTGFEKWAWQLSCYMWATKRPAVYVVGRKSSDGKEIEETDTYFVSSPPIGMAEIRGKVMRIWAAVRAGSLPEGCGGERMWPCAVWWLHDGEEEVAVEDADEQWDELVKEYALLQEDMKDTKAKLDEVKQLLVDNLGTGKKRSGVYTVNIWHTTVEPQTIERKGYTSTTLKIEKEEE